MRPRTRCGVALAVVALVACVTTACQPERVYSYRIATRGPTTADVGQFAAHVESTLADPRGWSLGGAIVFSRTDGPADFTIWLSTAANVPSFSSGCSSQWSCRAGPNVIINQDRWLSATPAWPYGVDAYQHYVVNHEVGHWLGLGHRTCPAPGVRAPVMVQQSKGGSILGSCRFNVWPGEDERQNVAGIHGVGVRSSGLPNPDDPFGNLDVTDVTRDVDGRPTKVRVAGWAIDGDTADAVFVVVDIDGQPVNYMLSDLIRDDVAGSFPRFGPAHGFDLSVDVASTAQIVCVDVLGVGAGAYETSLGCAVIK